MIDFVYRLRAFLLLVLLLSVSLFVMTKNRPLMRSVRAQSLKVVGAVEYRMSWAAQIVRSARENEKLRNENLLLTSKLARLRIVDQENETLRQALGWQRTNEFETIAARIIARGPFGATNFLTLDVGSNQGVEMNMAVITHTGILGRIVELSRDHSKVMPYLHSQFSVPVMIDTLGAVGIVSGQNSTPNALMLNHVLKTENIQLGQRVITHEASGVFPPNIPVGLISAHEIEPGSNFLEIKVAPATSLHTTHFAFVVLSHSGQRTSKLTADQYAP